MTKKSPTRDELVQNGTILLGAVVPEWFKDECDGCSVPARSITGPFLLRKRLRAACLIHDWDYTTIPMLFPAKSQEAKKLRKEADKRLKKNCKRILHEWSPLKGYVMAPIYYWSLRGFGKRSMTPIEEKQHRWPRTTEQFMEMLDALGIIGFPNEWSRNNLRKMEKAVEWAESVESIFDLKAEAKHNDEEYRRGGRGK